MTTKSQEQLLADELIAAVMANVTAHTKPGGGACTAIGRTAAREAVLGALNRSTPVPDREAVLEEAARVADSYVSGSRNLEGDCYGIRIAAAIRALKLAPPPPSDPIVEGEEPTPERHAAVAELHELGAPASHVLKTWPPYFQQLLDGTKQFEVRKDDRGYAVGDILDLVEYDPSDGAEYGLHHTGRNVFRRVTYVLRGGQFGIEAGYVVLGLENYPTAPEPSPIGQERGARTEWLAARLRAQADFTIPHDPKSHLYEAADTLSRLSADIEELVGALKLAANRLDSIVVEAIADGNPRRWEWSEWADHARATASKHAERGQ